MAFYDIDKLQQIMKCYRPEYSRFLCPSCWLPFDRLATVARHKTVHGLVVHAACRIGPLPACYTCGETATSDRACRKYAIAMRFAAMHVHATSRATEPQCHFGVHHTQWYITNIQSNTFHRGANVVTDTTRVPHITMPCITRMNLTCTCHI